MSLALSMVLNFYHFGATSGSSNLKLECFRCLKYFLQYCGSLLVLINGSKNIDTGSSSESKENGVILTGDAKQTQESSLLDPVSMVAPSLPSRKRSKVYILIALLVLLITGLLLDKFLFSNRLPTPEMAEAQVKTLFAKLNTGDNVVMEMVDDSCYQIRVKFSFRTPITACGKQGAKYWVTKDSESNFIDKISQVLIDSGFRERTCLLSKDASKECTAEKTRRYRPSGEDPMLQFDANATNMDDSLYLITRPSGLRKEPNAYAEEETESEKALEAIYEKHGLRETSGKFLYGIEYGVIYSAKR